MLRQLKMMLAAIFAIPLIGTVILDNSYAAAAAMTNYRVYQNDNAIKEFATKNEAISYAKGFAYAHVETITGRDWVWDNLPRYKIYQGGVSKSSWEYSTYAEALAAAKKLSNVHIRDLE